MAKKAKAAVAPESTPKARRGEGGRFLPGASGNPGGRPSMGEVRQAIADEAPASVRKLVELRDGKDAAIALRAAERLLEWSLGKPAQAVVLAEPKAEAEGRVSAAGRAILASMGIIVDEPEEKG